MTIQTIVASVKPYWPVVLAIFFAGGTAARVEIHIQDHESDVTALVEKIDRLDLRVDNVELKLTQIESEVTYIREAMDEIKADTATRFDRLEKLIMEAHFK